MRRRLVVSTIAMGFLILFVTACGGGGGCDCDFGHPPEETAPAPRATTNPATLVTPSSVTLNGAVNPKGAATSYFFEWGIGAYDNVTPTISAGTGTTDVTVVETLTGLDPETKYQFRLVATNENGTDRGTKRTFTTTTPVSRLVFAGGGYGTGVTVVDIESMTIVGTISDAGGYRMVFSRDGAKLYSTGGDSNIYISDAIGFGLITVIDPSDVAGVESRELEAVAISPDGATVYFVDESGAENIFVLSTATETVTDVDSILSDEPENALVSPDGRFLFVVDNSDALKVDLSTLTVVGSISVGSDAHGIALSLDGTKLYAKGDTGGIDVISTATMTLLVNIPGANEGYYLELGKDGRMVYGVDESDGLSVIDTQTDTLVTNLTLSARSARGVTTTADGATILVATSRGLIKLDAVTLLETGFLVGSFQSVAVRPALSGE